tara:strand:- start:368 stop:1090 length:723 start_codon:yes stop_codon:yes gene_type:complete
MVIISSSHNYTKNQLYTLVKSLNDSGYTDKKVMVVYECDSSTKKFLIENGWEIYERNLNNIQVVSKRFKDIPDILRTYNEYEQILVTDSRDVYFHKNPKLLPPHDLFIGIDGDYLLKDNEWATKEMMKMYPTEYDTIKNKHHLCAGVVLGKNKNIINLFEDVYDYIFKSELKVKKSTVDQMALNILAYTKYNYTTIKDNSVINLSCTDWDVSEEYNIYHQYDRVDDFWLKIKSNIKKTVL